MINSRPGVFAVRVVNDYRRRDVFGFLGVRYYLDNVAARTDEWAQRVASALVKTRSTPVYFNSEHFKELSEAGGIEHRSIFIPGPNECIAEAALLAECARHSRVFGNPDCVYSYTLNDSDSRSGTFRPYTCGLRDRHSAIAKACEAMPEGVVRYADIMRCYPNINIALVRAAWDWHCREAGIASDYTRLGHTLIEGYAESGLQATRALLTGPMFSHLLANLVLRDFDREMSATLPVAYCRYVDDIVLVGKAQDVASARQVVKERLGSLGLALHEEGSPKDLTVPCTAWLVGRDDFSEKRGGTTWMRLIGNLKRYLIQHPEQKEALHRALLQEGMRIPVPDYSAVIREHDFAAQILRFAPWNWFRRKAQALSVTSIVELAKRLRGRLEGECDELIDGAAGLAGYERKRRLTKLRYCIARLVYLSSDDKLLSLAESTAAIPEVFFHHQVMQAVATRNIDRVLAMGTNAAQATAQPLRAARMIAVSKSTVFQTAKEQSLAVFAMNGVAVQRPAPEQPESELVRFAIYGADRAMMTSDNAFVREIACLHGICAEPRHTGVFECAFDEDEALSMDAVTQLQQSVT